MINTIGSNPIDKISPTPTPVDSGPPKDLTQEAPKFEKKFSKEQKKKIPSKYLIAGILLLVLTIGGGIGLFLMQQKQDLRQQANAGDYVVPTTPPNPTTPPQPTTEPTVGPTTEPTIEPTVDPTIEPTIEPTDEPVNPTDEPSDDDSSSSYSYSESNSSATVNINNENTTTVAGGTATNRYAPTEPTLPPELPRSGPEDWIQYLQIGLGTLGIGALLLLFL